MPSRDEIEQARRRSYALIAEVDARREPAAPEPEPKPRDYLAEALAMPIEDPVAKWKREADAQEARFKAAREVRRAEEEHQLQQQQLDNTEAWDRWADRRIRAALEEHDRLWTDAIGGALAEIRKQLRDEIQTAVGELRAEINVQAAAEKADIVTLPSPLRKKRHDAA